MPPRVIERPTIDEIRAARGRIAPVRRMDHVRSVKTALALMGKVREEFRLPMCPMGEKNRERLVAALAGAGLLAG